MDENSMVVFEEKEQIVSSMNANNSSLYTSFKAETREDQVRLYNATITGNSLKEAINKKIDLADVVIMPVEVKNNDGTTSVVPRSTLIAKDGTMYTATSWGVYNGLARIKDIFGTLHFEDTMVISPVTVKTKNGETINIRLA